MQGVPGNEGIIPRSIDVIFNSISDHIAEVRSYTGYCNSMK